MDRLIDLLASFGIVEMARTGLIAMRCGLNGGTCGVEGVEDSEDDSGDGQSYTGSASCRRRCRFLAPSH